MYLILQDDTLIKLRQNFFNYRSRIEPHIDSIVCFRNKENGYKPVDHSTIKNLLLLEGEYRLINDKWDENPTLLKTVDFVKSI